jgi:hypothetical protein
LNPIKTSKKLEWLVPNKTKITSKSTSKPILVYILSGFLVLQLVLPFRHVLYEGHVDWNGLGQRFSWRMKIMYKEVDMHFYLVEEGKTDKLEVNLGNFLNDKQYTNLMYYPDFIPIVAQYIKKVGVEKGLKNPKVLADFKVGFNGNKKMILVDPEADLSKVKYATGNELYWLKSKVW